MDTYNDIFIRHQKKLLFLIAVFHLLTLETLVWEVDVAFLAFLAAFFLRNSSSCKKERINCNSTW
ncbi:hypothetical protein ES319_A13G097700v1 [Gossypium barbadense]|uniref:Uncharacterized protein n=2 Tax=Gossypium TaxID=3633 RepID=A0A5J5SXH5_GOSBA|nr:hypothetical protein ES319_A13G097700v1 [Gossypium barbadense]TYG86069.1 hypothetical protein ES288_A13G106000v1 [Gossypium darwinii]